MLTRRQFGAGAAAGAAASVLAPAVLRAQTPTKMRVALASGVSDAQVAFQTIGMHPRLHWYQDEGIEAEIINTGNTSQPLQLLTTGQVEFATIAPGTLLPVYADNPGLGVVCPYMWMPRIHNGAVVKPDSPIQSIADLKGKTIGIRNTGDSGYPFMQASLKEVGLDPNKDVEWIAVGAGGPAGQALHRDQVQALAIWDAEFARIEIAGFPLRNLPNPPGANGVFGNAYAATTANFEKNKEAFAKTFRVIAKGQVFTAANPRAAILLHWDLYPETKPKGKTHDEALGEMMKLLDRRRDKWFPHASSPDQRMGSNDPASWQASLRFIGQLRPEIAAKIKDPTRLYTNDVIAEANRFDRAALEAEAREFKV